MIDDEDYQYRAPWYHAAFLVVVILAAAGFWMFLDWLGVL